MNLYNRNYFTITDQEKEEWDNIKQKEIVLINGEDRGFRKPMTHKYPEAVRHYDSLFPNNHIDVFALEDYKTDYEKYLAEYQTLIENDKTTESDIQKIIKDNKSYFIICSILRHNFHFGHHEVFLFPEFELPPSYKVDYLLIGSSTGGFEFIFIELENPYNEIILKDGSFGQTIRKGIKQIEDWDEWLEQNYPSLSIMFEKASNKKDYIPREFRKYDKSRVHYSVIAGRRSDYDERTYRLRRKYKDERKILILHYDNLIDYSKTVLKERGY